MLTLTIIQDLDLHFVAALPSTLFQSTFHTSDPSPLQHSHAHLNISNAISYEQKTCLPKVAINAPVLSEFEYIHHPTKRPQNQPTADPILPNVTDVCRSQPKHQRHHERTKSPESMQPHVLGLPTSP